MAARKAVVAEVVTPIDQDAEVIEGDVIDEVKIGDVIVRMRRATDDQLIVLMRYARIAEKTQTMEAGNRAIEIFFEIVENLLVNKEDVDRLVSGVTRRTVTVKAITESMQTKKDDGEESAPAARTRRGR